MKTEFNLFFYDNKWSNCPLSLVAAMHKLYIHLSVLLFTIKTRGQEALTRMLF